LSEDNGITEYPLAEVRTSKWEILQPHAIVRTSQAEPDSRKHACHKRSII